MSRSDLNSFIGTPDVMKNAVQNGEDTKPKEAGGKVTVSKAAYSGIKHSTHNNENGLKPLFDDKDSFIEFFY